MSWPTRRLLSHNAPQLSGEAVEPQGDDVRRGSGILIVGLLVTACLHRQSDSAPTPPVPEGTPVHVLVTNNFTLPITVYASAGGTTYRMGTVNPGMNADFVLQQSMMGSGPVEFLADPNNGETPFRSGGLLLAPGATVDINVEQHLLNSSATIRP